MHNRRGGSTGAKSALGAAIALALHALAVPSRGEEQERETNEGEQQRVDADPPLPPGDEKRPYPAYAQPPDEGVAEAALWVPRVVLFPLYVVTEYGITRPAGALFTWAERNRIRERYFEFFTLDEERKISLYPTGTIDLGLRPTVGAYFSWDDAVGDSDLRLRVTTGGLDLWTVNTLFHAPIDGRSYLRFNADYSLRPDSAFYGLGREIRHDGAHYLSEHFVGRTSFTQRRSRLVVSASAGVIAQSFDPGPDGVPDESLADAIATGRLEAPPGLRKPTESTLYGSRCEPCTNQATQTARGGQRAGARRSIMPQRCLRLTRSRPAPRSTLGDREPHVLARNGVGGNRWVYQQGRMRCYSQSSSGEPSK